MKQDTKLYLSTISIMFASNDANKKHDAIIYFRENTQWHSYRDACDSVKEITSQQEVPEEWRHALIYGTEDEITPLDFLEKQQSQQSIDSPEYQEYLRLKEKYEHIPQPTREKQ
jgi:hypothetical protein